MLYLLQEHILHPMTLFMERREPWRAAAHMGLTLRLFPVAASRAVTVLHCLFVLATEVKVKAHPARRAVSQSVSRKHKHVK